MSISILFVITIRQTSILMRQVKIFLLAQKERWEDLLGNQNENKKHHSEEETQEGRLTDSYVYSLYKELSKHFSRTSDATHYDHFRCEDKQLYFKGRDEPFTCEDGTLKTFGRSTSILGKNRLRDLGFDIPSCKQMPQESIILNKTEEELASMSDMAKAGNVELQEIMENIVRSRSEKHRESHQATRGRILQGFADVRTFRSRQTAQKH